MFSKGQVVISTAGRDKNNLLVIVDEDSIFVYVCDGKERPLNNPKRKNPKHVTATEKMLTHGQMQSDRALRKALAASFADIEKGR